MRIVMNKKSNVLPRVSIFAFLLFCGFGLFVSAANALGIESITSEKGLTAWLVEDRTVPVVSIQFSIGGGTTQDPEGKEGLANLMTGLFDEGAGDLNSDAFQSRLDAIGAEMAFSTNRDRMRGSMKVLAENSNEAFNLLALAVQKPRFDEEAINRIREQLVAELKASEKDPKTIAQNRLLALIYGKHPYGRRGEGTPETLNRIKREDLVNSHQAMFARDNIHIGIVGPVSRDEATKIIDRIFGDLPEKAKLQNIEEAKLNLGGMANVNYDLPQTSLMLVYPGIKRNDPDFFAAYLMNYVLGGPGLTSRLFSEVREKRGLAYTVGSSLMIYEHSAALAVSTGTRSSEAQKTLSTIRNEVRKMADEGVSEQELDDAKSYVIGSYAVQNMGSSSDIAATLVGLQDEKLPIDYIDKRRSLIEAVTRDQVKAIAEKLLRPEPALLVIGPSKS
ncbi:pitrilysin family protein [uncultured Bartonella sp.]|uniref:M16 family metallopeptidase n=1 Tax=uncultured Bartonella sp. TaxID=104108 RepID=UPI002607F332|nr:pitrilysin family protein [uncultured Bartonella sp.]